MINATHPPFISLRLCIMLTPFGCNRLDTRQPEFVRWIALKRFENGSKSLINVQKVCGNAKKIPKNLVLS